MADTSHDTETSPEHLRATPLGVYDRPRTETITSIEFVAIAVSAVWLIGAALFFLFLPSDASEGGTGAGALRFLMTLMVIVMPIAMIWVAASAARASKVMRDESRRLQASIDAIRQTYIAQNQSGISGVEPASV
ncbi:MAG: hypothetical protein PVI41_05285, partial [Roseobacter sp.]